LLVPGSKEGSMKGLYSSKYLEKEIGCGIIAVMFNKHGNKSLKSGNQIMWYVPIRALFVQHS